MKADVSDESNVRNKNRPIEGRCTKDEDLVASGAKSAVKGFGLLQNVDIDKRVAGTYNSKVT